MAPRRTTFALLVAQLSRDLRRRDDAGVRVLFLLPCLSSPRGRPPCPCSVGRDWMEWSFMMTTPPSTFTSSGNAGPPSSQRPPDVCRALADDGRIDLCRRSGPGSSTSAAALTHAVDLAHILTSYPASMSAYSGSCLPSIVPWPPTPQSTRSSHLTSQAPTHPSLLGGRPGRSIAAAGAGHAVYLRLL